MQIYLANGKELMVESLKINNFCRQHKAPIGSHVTKTPNAYMTNKAWFDISSSLCDGIRATDTFCWWRLGGKWFLVDVTRLGLNQLFVGLTAFVSTS
jgi:hypothetical protein